MAGPAPDDYRDPQQFFARTYFTRALREHSGMVLRRLAGRTENTAPVMTLVTQFGGGKTHTLTALYHLARNPETALQVGVELAVTVEAGLAKHLETELRLALDDLRLGDSVRVERRTTSTSADD